MVVVTTGQIEDAVRNIAGDSVLLLPALCGAEENPHSYTATTNDIKNLSYADIVFYNGFLLEEQMQYVLNRLGSEKAVAVSKDIPEEKLLKMEHKGSVMGTDPHIWNNPKSWILCVKTITEILCARDSVNANYFRANSLKYIAEIDSLHNYAIREFSKIELKNRILVSSHDAFNYFAQAYNIKTVAVMGISSNSETGINKIRELADFIVENKVHTIFMESSVNPKGIEALKEAVESRGGQVEIFRKPLFSDALAMFPPENTYLGMLKSNIDAMVEGMKNNGK